MVTITGANIPLIVPQVLTMTQQFHDNLIKVL